MSTEITKTLVSSNEFSDTYDVYLGDELIGQDVVFKPVDETTQGNQ